MSGLVSAAERRHRPRTRIALAVLFGALVLAAVGTLFPLYWMGTGALKGSTELLATPPTWWPQSARWGNYPAAWNILDYGLYYTNTVVLVAGVLVLQLFVSATAAFALSKLEPRFGGLVFFLFLSQLMVPKEAYLIPLYLTVVDVPVLHVNLTNTWWAVWLPGAAHAFTIVVLKSFFDRIPNELIDAARLDGASNIQILVRVILPMARPALAVVTIFIVVASWKDFLWPMLVLSDPDKQPLMVAIYTFAGSEHPPPLNVVIAGLVLASIPPVAVFLVFQRHIVRGVTLTGLKG